MYLDRGRIILLLILCLIALWVFMFMNLFADEKESPREAQITYSLRQPVKLPEPNTELIKKVTHHKDNTLLKPVSLHLPHNDGTKKDKSRLKALLNTKLSVPIDNTPPDLSIDPPSIPEIEKNLTYYLHTLHSRLSAVSGPTATGQKAWDAFFDVTKNTLVRWDDENRHRLPKPRKDNSIFVSLGTYRDPYCPMTMKSLYSNAGNPELIFVGLFQQNCFGPKCRTGVLAGGKVEDAGPDPNCYELFCASEEGINSNACNNGHVRLFNVNESESLGPYMARYLGAKFYRGEQYYLQIDSHSEFVQNWDHKLIKMVEDAPAEKPVISTYPPDSTQNWRDSIGFRMCDSEFASAQIEWQIIRLGSSLAFDHEIPDIPAYAPFVAAGFFFTYGDFLSEVPFDPLLPWIFMGEEISMSARLWTSGYDIFSPTINVLNHYYVRRHYPKFWESVNRFFKRPIHNDILEIIINRVKYMLGYPESCAALIEPSSVIYRLDDWGMGKKRSMAKYMEMVGLDMNSKQERANQWCHRAEWPEIAKEYRISKY